jgi:HD-GYP domain-containing protein (c-di-GMP phosphodiesterase class II)
VLYHHERWDGRGYPEGLAAEEIPLSARIFSVCDALEAMTAARPYRGPLPATVAFERVRLEAGQQFDPQVVDALARGVDSGEIDLVAAGGLDVEQPPRRRISSALR